MNKCKVIINNINLENNIYLFGVPNCTLDLLHFTILNEVGLMMAVLTDKILQKLCVLIS